MKKVSVIIPVYNTEKYLDKCLNSVCNQTLKDIEIICVNDCSTDNSTEILKEYAAKDTRIKLIDFKENRGVSAARNKGLDDAKGEYIGFIDSDDFVDFDFYEKLYDRATKTNADCVKGNIYDYDFQNGESVLTDFYNQNDKISENKAYFYYGFTSAIYRNEFIKKNNIKFPENISYFEDPYFSVLASILMSKVEIINSAKYYYVRHNDSACLTCKNINKTITSLIKSIYLIIDFINNSKVSEEDYSIYISFLIKQIIPWCSNMSLRDEDNIEAVKTLYYILTASKYDVQASLIKYYLNLKNSKQQEIKNNKDVLLKKLHQKLKHN